MSALIINLNLLVVGLTALIGFFFGWLWYSPVLFAKVWQREMKLSDEKKKSFTGATMARMLIQGFVYTLVSTFGLAVIVAARGNPDWVSGAKMGFFLSVVFVTARLLNTSLWEERSWRLQAINIGHEILLFTLQGSILAVWH